MQTNLNEFKDNHDYNTRTEYVLFIIDLSMLFLAIISLVWLAFDEVFDVGYVQTFFRNNWSGFYNFYTEIHENFLFYDGILASIFIVEFLCRWVYSMYSKRYSRWFMYPLIHFYDLLGCLPTGPLRLLRLFRVVILAYKLYKWRVVDFNRYPIVNTLVKYYNIMVQAIADRVAVRILSEVKLEFQRGNHIMDEIINQVFIPRKQEVLDTAAKHLQDSIAIHYKENRKDFQKYLRSVVLQAAQQNKEMENLEKIPMVGPYLKSSLKEAISDIVFRVFDQLVNDFSNDKDNHIPIMTVQTMMDFVLVKRSTDSEISVAAHILNDVLDIIINRISEKQWTLDNHADKLNE